ncbi:MAG: M23 family metallopeptidase, partial [Gemmatimonadota bacterium]
MRLRSLVVPAAVLLVGAAAVFGRRWYEHRLPVARPIDVTEAFRVVTDTLRAGETLQALLIRTGLRIYEIDRVIELIAVDPRRLRPGLAVRADVGLDEPVPRRLEVKPNEGERVELIRNGDSWRANRHLIPWTTSLVRLEGRIQSSLYDALDRATGGNLGKDNRVVLAWDVADVFAWQLDFTRDVQPGDRIAVVLERRVSDEGYEESGKILAAEMTVAGKLLTAFRFEAEAGARQFYDESGESLKRAFLRAPVEFRRISSGFSSARLHPILGIFRRHQGMDYAAAAGTPVLAAGDGVVAYENWAGGYGRMIELRHRNGVSTRYAHLLGFVRGVRLGSRVAQGDVIGFVGST